MEDDMKPLYLSLVVLLFGILVFFAPVQPVVHAYSGSWQVVDSPNPTFGGYDTQAWLSGVAASRPDDAWAIGSFNADGSRALLEHWDGTAWSIVDLPNFGGTGSRSSSYFSGVAVA